MATALDTLPQTNNPLLIKADIGKALKRGFELPNNKNFTYGKANQKHASGAADAMGSWNAGSRVLAPLKTGSNGRDFIQINRLATKCGLVTAKEQSEYRATHDATTSQGGLNTSGTGSASFKRLPPNQVYGVPTKPSTPVFDLLEHKYQDRWLQNRRKDEMTKSAQEDEKKGSSKMNSYCETRASRLRRYSPPVDPPPLWQMSKFQKVLPALETFRTDEARESAFEHHKSDCTSRHGVFGHGCYQSAKS